MKCQILFPGKNKKNITNLSSAELANYLMFCSCRAPDKFVRLKITLLIYFYLTWKTCFGVRLLWDQLIKLILIKFPNLGFMER